MKDRPTPTRVHAPRTKDGEDDAVTFRRPRTRMDEPGHHFSGVKRPPGCRETGAPRKTRSSSHKSQFPSSTSIMRHRRRLPRDNTDTLIASSWAVGRRPGHRFPDAKLCPGCQCPPRSRPSGRYAFTHRNNGRRVAGGRPPEADLKRPAGQPYRGTPPAATSLDWGQPRVSPRRSRDEFGLGPATRCGAPRPRRTSSCTESVELDPFCRHDVEFPCCQ